MVDIKRVDGNTEGLEVVEIKKEKGLKAALLINREDKISCMYIEEFKEKYMENFDIVSVLESRGEGKSVGIVYRGEENFPGILLCELQNIVDSLKTGNSYNDDYLMWEWEGDLMLGDITGAIMYTSDWNKKATLDVDVDDLYKSIVRAVERS